ncbi:MAG: DUF6288 domain-containing protein, partial [Phycisphaeraceae bacterium]|nr:DUF6288 domain-containing protein [Phycisphaeraceae bacterium]
MMHPHLLVAAGRFPLLALVATILTLATTAGPAAAENPVPGTPYYTEIPHYIPYPQAGKTWTITNYGPVGIGLDLIDPNFTMRINKVHPGSPAAATGKLKKGQIIETINSKGLADIDPRVVLAEILGEAEATDGKMRFKLRGQPEEVVVQLPVMGAYSDTWPLDCPKSDKIVRRLADVLAKQEKPRWGSVLFLLSTGEEKDLEVVRRWMQDFNGTNHYPWFNGMIGIGVCEYYLRTGDERILPVIKGMTEELKKNHYAGGWSGRGKASFTYMAGGHLNAAGVPCLTFLLLARQCGVEVDEYTLQSALRHMYRYSGHGNVAYGDQMPEGGFRDNGKTAVLALAMAAAAQLTPEPEQSVYAGARDNSAMKSFYASSWFNRAHTGGGIGEMWHANAMQLLREKKPAQWRSFMDERRWHFELSRRPDGSIGIEDCDGYDVSATEHTRSWGTIHALVYTAARKNLRIFGAPPTKWSKKHPLPERPWGTPADDVFQSLEPAEHAPGQQMDLSRERIPTDASAALNRRLRQSDPRETSWQYAHHPEFAFRMGAAKTMVQQNLDDLILRCLKSNDPRVRDVGVGAITGGFKRRAIPADRVTDEMWQLVGEMIQDPDESLWVTLRAMQALQRAPRHHVEPHVDRLVQFLDHDDWWVHTSAIKALTKLAADDDYYQQILPPIARIVQSEFAYQSSAPAKDIVARIKTASPEVKEYALDLFGKAYRQMPETVVAPGGQVTPNQTEVLRGRAYSFLLEIPGNRQLLLDMPKLTSKWQGSREESDKYIYTEQFTANDKVLGTWKVVDKVGTIDAFKFDKKRNTDGWAFKAITFKKKGKTDHPHRLWTGDTLVDLTRNVAVKFKFSEVKVPPKGLGGGPGGDPLNDPLGDESFTLEEDG